MTRLHTRKKMSPIWSLIFILFQLAAVGYAERCLKNISEVNPKNYLHYEKQSLNITLEVSNRVSHQLITHMFKILLQEYLGYPKVEIKYHENQSDPETIIARLSGPIHDTQSTAPESMINLEVWVPPDYDDTQDLANSYVKDCGSISMPGRYGWFIPKNFSKPIEDYYRKLDIKLQADVQQDVHWPIFTDIKIAQRFDILNVNLIHNISQLASKAESYCPECDEGWYVPPYCATINTALATPKYESCALLLAPDYNSTKFVIDQIRDLKLYVKVLFLGPQLNTVMKMIDEEYKRKGITDKSYVALSWYPSEVVYNKQNFYTVTFPSCDYVNPNSYSCQYEAKRLIKYSWSKLDKLAPRVIGLARRLTFAEDEISSFLQLYNEHPEKNYEQVACAFLSQDIGKWITYRTPDKPRIYIGGIFPITGSSYSGKGIFKAALMATEAINKNNSILPDYDLQLFIHDGECSADQVMKIFIDYIKNEQFPKLAGVLGPACSETVEPLAGVSKHYKSLVISYSAEGASFSDRKKYPYFFRTIGENQQYKYVYLKVLQEFRWKRVAALTEDGQKYTEYISHMQSLLKEKNIMLVSNTKFPKDRGISYIRNYLVDLKERNARIIIADVFDQVARAAMCEAFKLGMTAENGYVWFLPTWLNKTWYNTTYFNEYNQERINCTTEQMIESINGYLTMTHAYFAGDNDTMQENISVGQWRNNYTRMCQAGTVSIEQSNYAGYAYDAVWTYAFALDQLIKEYPESVTTLHDENTTEKLVNLVQSTDFNGVSGLIKFHGPSRISAINVLQWYKTDKELHQVATYTPEGGKEGAGNLTWNQKIRWFTKSGNPPEDGTVPPVSCALDWLAEALDVSCDNAIIILNVVVFSIFFALVSTALYVIKNKMKNRYKNEVERTMKSLGLDLIYPLSGDLDKWEIPRETVVINRKLGEGAFGTVYGGEANFSDKGWQAVAVKTLKVGSSTNEKVDFLSEAEVMKRFDHKNIVKLLGVVTKTEPVYTVMEFMLYGDLKTYLLARRHLVNNNVHVEECEDISPKRLTAMALDVARGLSYLAELKYVHRDIASRNCLINAQRVVKLGDFGMTRPISENDYYRFHRKGMLPVRWMSPESLALGLFTPASDVWSYGVLLYEIITFGSFPFQGLSNSQVLDHVKAGNTIPIPPGVKVQLEGLLKSCWQQEFKSRPQASEIVEFLANNPRLICPCLDIPLSSVQMEDTGQLEMHLPQQFRKCSSSLSFKNLPTQNGVVHNSAPPTARKLSIPESGSYLQLDNCCPREPLLGAPMRSNSLLGLTKYVTIQHNHFDSGCEHDESEDNYRPNGTAVTKI